MSSATATPRRTRSRRDVAQSRATAWLERLESPVTTYYVLLSATAVLVVIGVVMVLSASSVTSLVDSKNRTAYAIFLKQLEFAAIGTLALVLASRLKTSTWKRLAIPLLGFALALQALVFTRLGITVNGNRNWLALGPITVQPSELVKMGLALVGASVLSAKRRNLGQVRHALVPYVLPIAAVAIGLVLVGKDLGTVILMSAIIAAALFAAGVPARLFGYGGAAFASMTLFMVLTSHNRVGRFDVWLGKDTNPYGAARQPLHGRYALADGGWWGVGLGASREKWQWLPEAHNDFIFAIIGEELGLPGTLVILALFCVLALACYRLVMRSKDPFVRIATAGVMAWVIVQAMVNIGAVIGLLPVIGVPLPLVSSGGSSLVTTMLALGMLLSFARREPGCAKALTARPSVVRRSLAVLPGRRRGRG